MTYNARILIHCVLCTHRNENREALQEKSKHIDNINITLQRLYLHKTRRTFEMMMKKGEE